MEGLRQYAFSVVTAAILCSIASCLSSQDTTKNLLRTLSGVILTLVAIRPIVHLEIPSLDAIAPACLPTGDAAVEEGRELAQDAMADIIKSACEAYILDKATALGADIQIHVSVNQERVPSSAAISGQVSAGAKQQLETILETDLGIAKENQSWTQ